MPSRRAVGSSASSKRETRARVSSCAPLSTVRTLTQDDFEVFEDNKPQVIESFRYITVAGTPQEGELPRQISTTWDEETELARITNGFTHEVVPNRQLEPGRTRDCEVVDGRVLQLGPFESTERRGVGSDGCRGLTTAETRCSPGRANVRHDPPDVARGALERSIAPAFRAGHPTQDGLPRSSAAYELAA